jgi:hypothetical protein
MLIRGGDFDFSALAGFFLLEREHLPWLGVQPGASPADGAEDTPRQKSLLPECVWRLRLAKLEMQGRFVPHGLWAQQLHHGASRGMRDGRKTILIDGLTDRSHD